MLGLISCEDPRKFKCFRGSLFLLKYVIAAVGKKFHVLNDDIE